MRAEVDYPGIAHCMRLLHQLWVEHGVRPKQATTDWLRHVPREDNTEADAAAGSALRRRRSHDALRTVCCRRGPLQVRASFDGSYKPGKVASGAVVQVRTGASETWVTSRVLGEYTEPEHGHGSAMIAELRGLELLLETLPSELERLRTNDVQAPPARKARRRTCSALTATGADRRY